ncbi:DNA-J related domain-containing protein [Pseudoalteromonas sp. MMG012]|uniref:DNA-J related domain-containing protein n=1 Tax=Pseudoalteromonas sp. MMG012 TaxID=2822686 RepID=UPI001B39F091|nr:DNA-J related domain-containing protein [Pseudoalteromonas sp. MMG012]MBQ4850028.1 molecular chaperone DnaJ [Pseudoalteromonas sp. MMG012]
MFNPLLDAIFIELSSGRVFKIHTLAAQLNQLDWFELLDEDPNKALFKKNFLIMNALFQLQDELLATDQSLHIDSMDIYLSAKVDNSVTKDNPLKSYYLDWDNYNTSREDIESLLTQFWQRFSQNNHTQPIAEEELQTLCAVWQLPIPFSSQLLTKKWRKLALLYHPDKNPAGSEAFKKWHSEYIKLKSAASN